MVRLDQGPSGGKKRDPQDEPEASVPRNAKHGHSEDCSAFGGEHSRFARFGFCCGRVEGCRRAAGTAAMDCSRAVMTPNMYGLIQDIHAMSERTPAALDAVIEKHDSVRLG